MVAVDCVSKALVHNPLMFTCRKGRTPMVWMMAVACATGCGGGQQGVTVSTATHTSKAGDAIITYSGQPKPMAAESSNAVTVLTQAGATFSNITLEPAASLASTYIAFSRLEEGVVTINVLPYGSGSSQLIYQSPLGAITPTVSAYGTIMMGLTNGPA